MKEEERGIKRWLKRKISINEAVVVLFLITGGVSFAASPEVGYEHYYSEKNTNTGNMANRLIIVPYNAVNTPENIATSRYNGSAMELKNLEGIWNPIGLNTTGIGMIRGFGENATAMGYYTTASGGASSAYGYYARALGGSSTAIGDKSQAVLNSSTAVGTNSKALGESSSAYGVESSANGGQALALGARAQAKAGQSTAIGNDTYALGASSIAFGNDDTSGAYTDAITQYDYDNYFKYLYGSENGGAGIDTQGLYGFGGNGTVANRKYSPTVSQGTGSIAIGSRSVALANGAVSIGTLAFALKEGATALGTKTRAEGIGSMALGNLSNVFSDYSVATGNKTQVTNEGGMAYGYQAYSAGIGSLAIGREVSANAGLVDLAAIKAAFETDSPTLESLRLAGDKAKNVATGTRSGVQGVVQQNGSANYAVVVGNRSAATSDNSLAIGGNTFALAKNASAIGAFSYADAENAMAIGVGARVYDDPRQAGHTGISSMAIGKDAVATLGNSVALGVGSKTDYSYDDLGKAGYAPRNALAVPTSGKTGVISVGKKGEERRVVNVASGYLNTDAANVGQLKALEDTLNISISENSGKGVRYLATNKTKGDSALLEGKLNTSSDYKSYIDYVALRKTIEARIKLNHENISQETINEIDKKIADLKAANPDFEALQGITGLDATATGSNDEDAKKYSLLLQEIDKKKNEALAKTPAGATIDNYHNADNSGAKGADSIAIGYDAETSDTASNAVAIGKAAKVTAASGVAIGDGASVNTESSVAIGKGSTTTGTNALGYKIPESSHVSSESVYKPFDGRANVFTPNLGEFSIGNGENGTRRLTGLAAGINDTDAVNVGQYKALAGFYWRINANNNGFNRPLTSVNALEFLGDTDISTTAKVDTNNKKDQITFALNKETSIAEANKGSTKVATTAAIYNAIKDSKAAVSIGTDDLLTLTGEKSADITGNTFTLGINKTKLTDTIGQDFAKKDASNIDKAPWVTKLSEGTDGLVTKGSYTTGEGINPDTWKTKLGINDIPTSWNIKSGTVTTAIDKTNNTLTVTGADGISTSLAGANLTIGVDKNGQVVTGNNGIVTGGTVHTAIDEAKTTVAVNPATGGILSLQTVDGKNKAYTLGIDEEKLKDTLGVTNLATEYAKADASNIASNKTNWVNALSGIDGFTKSGDFKNAVGIDADKWKNALGVSNIDLHYKANGDTASKAVALSTGLTIQGAKGNNADVSGKNIWVESAADGVLNIKMAEKPEFTEVKTGANILNATGLTVGETSITSDKIAANTGSLGGIGFANNQTTGLVAATKAGNAVEYSQFTQALEGTLGNASYFNVRGDQGTTYKMELSKNPTIFIKGAETGVDPSKVKNIVTKIDGENVLIDLNDKIVVKGASIAGVTFTNENGKKEIHAGDAKITNLADGEVAEGSRGAVNGGQLWTVQNLATAAQETATEAKTNAAAAQETATEASKKANANETNIANNTSKIADHATTLQTHTTALANHQSLIDTNKENIAKGFSFSAENTAGTATSSTIKRALGDSLTIAGDGKNLSTSIDQDAKVIVSLKESPKFGNLTINDSGKITGLLKGTLDTDAVNLGQLKPIATAVNAVVAADGTVSAPKYTIGTTQFNTVQDAFNAVNTAATGKITFADGNSVTKQIGLGESIQFSGANTNVNVSLDQTSGIYKFSIIEDPVFKGKVTAEGFDAKGSKITNLGAGTEANDAVNFKQLQEVQAGLSSAVSLNLSAPVAYETNVGGEDTIVVRAKKSGEADTAYTFYKAADIGTGGFANADATAITAAEISKIKVAVVSKDGKVATPEKLTNIAAGDISVSSTDAINGSQLKPVLDALAMTWNPSTNEINSPQWSIGNKTFDSIPAVIKDLSTGKIGSLVLTDAGGARIIRAKNGNFYNVSDVNLDTLEANTGATMIPLADIRYSSLNPTVADATATTTPMQIGNVKAGTKDTDAVNLKQLKDLGLDPTVTDIKPVVTYDGNTKDTITLAGTSGTKITNLKEGDLVAGSKDAATVNQVFQVDSKLATLQATTEKAWNLGINAESVTKVNYGDSIKLTSDDNLVISSTPLGTVRTIKIATKDSPTFGNIKLQNSGDNAVITGLTNTAWDKTSIVSGRAATEDQLQAAITNINTSTANDDKFNVKYDKTGTDPNYTSITLNPSGTETKISNLAKGNIRETSTDAINGSQIYEVNKAIGDFIGAGTFNIGTGMLNPIKLPSVTNNGAESDTNSLTEALENLRYGFRIFSGKVGEGTIDTSAGATNIGNKQNLAILGDKNISTKVSKETVQVTRIVDGVSKTDSMVIPKLNITMSENPVFESIAAKKVLTIGDSLNTDPEKNAVISVNPEGKGYITGLRNKDFNVKINELDKKNLGNLSVTDDKAASEGQLKEIITDYVTRDDGNVKYDSDAKNIVTLNSAIADGVQLKNVAEGIDGKDAVNVDQLKTQLKGHSQAVADVIGTTVDASGKVVAPDFTAINGVKPTSVKDALDKLGTQINTGNSTLEGKIGDPSKDAKDGRNTKLTADELNGRDINSKANALRRGEAGIIVYTKADGIRVGKASDGQYYELSKINADGSLKDGAVAIELSEIRQSLVNAADGTTTTPTILSNLANGSVSSGSKDAITGDQLHKVVGSLGSLKTDGSIELNKIKFRGSVQTGDYDKTLGESVSIVGNTSVKTSTDLTNYEEKNIATENTADGISIKFAKNPEFTSVKATEKVTIGNNGLTLTNDAITGLKDLDDTADGNTAVNKNFVDAEIAKVTDTINTGNTALEGKIGDPAKDGTDGRNGLAVLDNLNGKDINAKANALRRGEAGIVVYTTENGTRVGRANNGKYYELSRIKADGTVDDENNFVPSANVRQSLVNPQDGTTNTPVVLSNLANGNIESGSKDAITGDQLHKVTSKLGSLDTAGNLTLNPIKFRGNVQTANYDKTLGDTVNIVGNTSVKTATDLANYEEKNIATENTADGISIKFAKNPEFASVKAAEKISVGDNGLTLTKDAMTGLKDLDANADASSAVNKKFVDDEIAKVTDKITGTGGLNETVGTGADGRDGKTGTSSTTGPTGKDGQNGKSLTAKVNALRNGEAGPVVYTDVDGNRLYKGNDGQYYTANNINLDTGETKGFASSPVRLSLVNQDGEIKDKNIVLDNIAAGKIDTNSKEAVNGSQLKDFADKVGLEVDNTNPTILKNPDLTKLKDEFVKDENGNIYKKVGNEYFRLNPSTGEFDNTPIASIPGEKAVEPKLVDRINLLTALNNELQAATQAGLTFRGDNADGTAATQASVPLGKALDIKGGKNGFSTASGDSYIGGNIGVQSSPTGLEIFTKAKPTFDGITLNEEGLQKTSAVRLDQLNALRRELKLPPITESDPDGNGIAGDQRNPQGTYPDPDPSTPNPGGTGNTTNDTVNALAKGEAGPVIYTTDTGEKVVLAGDNKFYNPEDVKGKLFYAGNWYDATKVKELDGKLYDVASGKEIQGDQNMVAAPSANTSSVKLSAVGPGGNTKNPTQLGNIAAGTDGKDATNVDQLNAIRSELGLAEINPLDKDGDGRDDNTGNIITSPRITAPTGPTGAGGGVGSTGAPGADGLNGTKLADKIEYLRDGYAGSVVYTDDNGERIIKGKDGKFYKPEELTGKIYADGKWYDAKEAFEKYDLKDGKWVDKGKDTLSGAGPEAVNIKPMDDNANSYLSLVGKDGKTSGDGVVLKNVGKGKLSADSTDAVNGSQLYEAMNSATDGKLVDGKDGVVGTETNSAGSKGNTSKDNLNGKYTYEKANALRNGEAGTLVYTNGKGERLFKGNDGEYYKFADLEPDGKPKSGVKASEEVIATVVQYDGSTDKPGKMRVGDGEVSEDSKEAVNGSQLHATNQKIANINSQNDARFEAHERAIAENTQRIEKLDTKVNKGLANAAAMSGISFMDVGVNQASVAAAVGGYKGTQAVAVGVQAAPTENVRVNAKVSLTPGSQSEGMYSVGAAYRFNFR